MISLQLMQNYTKFESLIRGEAVSLTAQQLSDFECYCSEESILPEHFCRIAVEIYRQNPDHARHFLQHISKEVMAKERYTNSFYNEAKESLYCATSVLCLGKAVRGTYESALKQQCYQLSIQYELKAQHLFKVVNYPSLLNRALIHLHQGDLAKCISIGLKFDNEFSYHFSQKALLTSAQIMLAVCYFAKRNYEKSLDYFRKCLARNKWLPVKARLGMAYCYFNLGRYEMSKVCTQRVLQLDPQNVDALICLAIIHERMEDYQNYFSHLKIAYQIDSSHPLLLYLLAEHFLIKGDLLNTQQMCLKGLSNIHKFTKPFNRGDGVRNDGIELEDRFINVQGQIQHKRKNFPLAIELYSRVAERELLWNDVSLAQCLISVKNYKEAVERMEYTYRMYEREKKDCRFLKDTYRVMAYLKNKCKNSHDPKDSMHYYNQAIKFDKNDQSLKEELAYLLTVIDVDKHKALRTMQELEKLLQANAIDAKPEILINIGVLLMENHEPEEGEMKLKRAIEMIEKWDDLDIDQQKGFLIIAKYNYGICLEKTNFNNKAIAIYEENLALNQCHLNSLLRKAFVLHKIGNVSAAIQILNRAESMFSERVITQIQIEKIQCMKAYLLYLEERYDESLQILMTISAKKPDYIYYKVLEFAIKYSKLTKKQPKNDALAEFMLSWKSYYEKICEKSNAEIFCFMVLTIINASLKLFNKDQAAAFFKKISVSGSRIPGIMYNMGLNYMEQQEENAAISCFSQHRLAMQTNKAEELVAYHYLINKDYKNTLKIVKKNILLEPANIRYRAQLVLATQARCEEELHTANKRILLNYHQHIIKCVLFLAHFQNIDLASIRDSCSKETIAIIKRISQQKCTSAEELKMKYERKTGEMEKESPRQRNSDESENEEDKRMRQTEEKKKKALAISRLKNQDLTNSWNRITEDQKTAEAEKLKRKAPKSHDTPTEGEPKRREKPKEKREDAVKTESQEYYSISNAKKEKLIKSPKERRDVVKEESEDVSLKKYLVE